MTSCKGLDLLDVEAKEATKEYVPSPGATRIGTSGMTAVPGSVPSDAPVPLEKRAGRGRKTRRSGTTLARKRRA